MTAAERLRDDVLGEPASLAALLDAAAAAGTVPIDAARELIAGAARVRFAGLGSSRYAALPVAAALRAAGRDAATEWSSAQLASQPDPGTALVAISASGATAETVAAARLHAGRSRVIAITNAVDSPLAAAADVVLPLLAGREQGGVACRTYLATCALLELVRGGGADDLRPVVTALGELHDARDAWVPGAADLLAGAGSIAVVAPDARIGAGEQIALLLREGPRLAAAAHETGEWAHVGVYLTVHEDHRVVLLPGAPGDAEVARWTRARGTPVLGIGPVGWATDAVALPHLPAHLRGMAEVSALELVAAELWSRRGGQPPGDV